MLKLTTNDAFRNSDEKLTNKMSLEYKVGFRKLKRGRLIFLNRFDFGFVIGTTLSKKKEEFQFESSE